MDIELLQQFCDVYTVHQAKRAYEKSISDFNERPFLSRVFGRRPADPAKGYSSSYLAELAAVAFYRCLPGLEYVGKDGSRISGQSMFTIGSDGKPSFTVTMTDHDRKIFNKEFFEWETGQGFIHGYQPSDDPMTRQANMQYAREYALSARMQGEPFDSFFKELDVLRNNFRMRDLPVPSFEEGTSLNLQSVVSVEKYSHAFDRDVAQAVELVESLKNRVKVQEVSDFVKTRFCELTRRGTVARGNRINEMYDVLAHDVYSAAVENADAVKLFDAARNVSERRPLDEVMSLSRRQVELAKPVVRSKVTFDDDALESFGSNAFRSLGLDLDYEILKCFTSNAFFAGYGFDEIRSEVDKYRKNHGLGEEFKPAYNVIHSQTADVYMAIVMEEVDAAFGKGVRDAAKVEISSPMGVYVKNYERVSDLQAAKNFLSEHDGIGPFSLLEDGTVSKANPYLLGAYVFSSGKDVSLDALSSLTGFPEDVLKSGYAASFGDSVLKQLDGVSLSPRTGSVPVNILSKDIVDTAVYLGSKDPELAGKFLLDAGVNRIRSGQDVVQSVVEAAQRMYENGNMQGSLRTADFRKKWSEFITAARSKGAQLQTAQTNKVNNVKKPKIS